MLQNLGLEPVKSHNGLLTTIAYQLDGKRHYALEGSIFAAGSTVQWLRDGIGIINSAAETAALAASADPEQQIYFVPAFTGLGAPHWAPDAQAMICGITRGTSRNELARAALESVAFQSRDLIKAMFADSKGAPDALRIRVDGGLSANDWAMQCLADMLDIPVERPSVVETTAMGAAYLAGYRAGEYPEPAGFASEWKLDRQFLPQMAAVKRELKYAGWRQAVTQTLGLRPAPA
jgi:glycerol kinase